MATHLHGQGHALIASPGRWRSDPGTLFADKPPKRIGLFWTTPAVCHSLGVALGSFQFRALKVNTKTLNLMWYPIQSQYSSFCSDWMCAVCWVPIRTHAATFWTSWKFWDNLTVGLHKASHSSLIWRRPLHRLLWLGRKPIDREASRTTLRLLTIHHQEPGTGTLNLSHPYAAIGHPSKKD